MTWKLLEGDCRDVLPALPAECVQCIVTSPPYYGLRSYAGVEASCWPAVSYAPIAGLQPITIEAMESCFGNEPTPEAYIGHLLLVWRQLWRVLRQDGTVWLNIGDSYASSGKESPTGFESLHTYSKDGRTRTASNKTHTSKGRANTPAGLKPKDLMLIPARVALALQADGWYLRSDIIHSKSNCMPESVTDRPTKSHEYVYLLAKSQKYYYDAEAVKEASVSDHGSGNGYKRQARLSYQDANGAPRGNEQHWQLQPTRNLRSVWSIATESYAASHFATMAPKLAETCILAGTSEHGCCSKCGKAWSRIVEAHGGTWNERKKAAHPSRYGTKHLQDVYAVHLGTSEIQTLGWQPQCTCNAEVIPCTILDPFAGAGTTLLEATRHDRSAIGIELSPAYAALARSRIVGDAPLFNTMEVAK